MKTLILNGSPRKQGDTAALLKRLRARLDGEIVQLNAYDGTISPCNDCRFCWKNPTCRIQDAMDVVYRDDYQRVIIASPIYLHNLTGPLLSLASRLQLYYARSHIQKKPLPIKKKAGALILTGGGNGSPEGAMLSAACIFSLLGASFDASHVVQSLKTDTLPAKEDTAALGAIDALADMLKAT